MTDPTPLSPAAQAVNHAYCKISYDKDVEPYFRPLPLEQKAIAAALRAAADQVMPEFWHEDNDIYGETMQDVRQNLLAIADELEGAQ